jgi:hypothetical protein
MQCPGRSHSSSLAAATHAVSIVPAMLHFHSTSVHVFRRCAECERRYCRPRFVLVGDAAHTVHPLAGQGVNMGFGDAACLTETIHGSLQCGRDLGDMFTLQVRLSDRLRFTTSWSHKSACFLAVYSDSCFENLQIASEVVGGNTLQPCQPHINCSLA